ncbi:hypothetical protein LTR27_005670 [Elasticomyces elasticus]|nr:hypothetical protein LTR27_005670 [Elasticomyces elasticus]
MARWIRKKNLDKNGKGDLRRQTEAEKFPWHRQIDFDSLGVQAAYHPSAASAAFQKTGKRKQTEAGQFPWHGPIDFSTTSK